MSQLLLFVLMMCDQTGIGASKCKKLHTECYVRVSNSTYSHKDADKLCDNALANMVWEKVKKVCK